MWVVILNEKKKKNLIVVETLKKYFENSIPGYFIRGILPPSLILCNIVPPTYIYTCSKSACRSLTNDKNTRFKNVDAIMIINNVRK